METRARYALIGLFTLVVIVAAFGFIYWLKRLDETGIRSTVYFEFSGSVGGLAPGGAVFFAGIKVGTVTATAFDPTDPNKVLVTAEVRQDTPAKVDSKAEVGANFLTGVAYVEMSGGTPGAESLFAATPPKLVGTQSALGDVLAAAGSAVNKLESIVDRVDAFLKENQESVTNTTRNVEAFTGALAANADDLKNFLASVSDLSDTASRLSDRLDGVIAKADEIVTAVDPDKVSGIISSTDDFMKKAADASANIQGIIARADEIAAKLDDFSNGLNSTLKNVDAVVAGVDPAKVSSTVDSLAGFSDKLKAATPDVDNLVADAKAAVANAKDFTANLTGQKEDLNAIVADAKELADRLNTASTKLNSVLGKADAFLGDENGAGKNFFQEAAGAARAIRKVAETLDAHAAEISGGLADFSTRGLTNVTQLVNELRATAARIDRAVTDLSSNPSGIVFGSNPSVREYNRR